MANNDQPQSGTIYQLIRKSGRSRIIVGFILMVLALLPFIFFTQAYRRPDYTLGVLTAMIPFAAGVWFIWQGIKRLKNPGGHSVMKTFAHYGNPKEIVDHIEAELINDAPAFHMRPGRGIGPSVGVSGMGPRYFFTVSWLLAYLQKPLSLNELVAVPFDEMVWVYKVVFNQGNLGTRETVAIKDQQGKELRIDGNDDIFAQLLRHAPWAFVGYSDENKRAWDTDKQAMIGTVAERRERFKQQPR